MGRRYYNGIGGLHQSEEEAVKWFEKAARQGHAVAQCLLGAMYEYGEGVPQSYQKAIEYYELSARQGFANAEFNLGGMFYTGRGVEKDWNRTREWWTRAAEHGHERASKELQELDEKEEEERKRNATTDKQESIDYSPSSPDRKESSKLRQKMSENHK